MRFYTILAIAPLILATPLPALRDLIKTDGETSGKYIVKLKDGVNKMDVIDVMSSSVTNEWTLINGFAVEANEKTLETLLAHPDVERVEEDGFAYTHALVTQTETVWGLSRLSSNETLEGYWYYNFNYTYDGSAGEGVDIYILDTGVFTEHNDFEGRAFWGASFEGTPNVDLHGHGTHTAGTAISATFGVAKKAHVYSVKVLGDYGSGAWSSVISGMDWVANRAAETGRPSVASMSLGGNSQPTVNEAAEALVASGVHTIASAGNSLSDVSGTSPAGAPSLLAIAATELRDRWAPYSNFGPGIDLLAPGTDVTSLYIGSPDATITLSGTSMSSPHVAGLIACLIRLEGNMTPAEMREKLRGTAQEGFINGVPLDTDNLLIHNGV